MEENDKQFVQVNYFKPWSGLAAPLAELFYNVLEERQDQGGYLGTRSWIRPRGIKVILEKMPTILLLWNFCRKPTDIFIQYFL